MSKTPLTRTALGLVAVALTLALGGCLKLDVAMTVTAEDTVNGTMILAIDKKLATATGQSEAEWRKQLAENAPTAAPGTKTEPYDDGTYLGTKVTFTDMSLADMESNATTAQALRVVHDKDAKTYTVSGELDLSQIGEANPMTAAFARTLDVRIAVTLPGDVVEHNGSLDGTTVTWVGKAGEKLTMHAVGEEPSPIPWVPVLAIGIPVLLVIAGLVWWLVARRRPAATGPATTGPDTTGLDTTAPAAAYDPATTPPADPWTRPEPPTQDQNPEPQSQQAQNLEAQQRPEADGQARPAHD